MDFFWRKTRATRSRVRELTCLQCIHITYNQHALLQVPSVIITQSIPMQPNGPMSPKLAITNNILKYEVHYITVEGADSNVLGGGGDPQPRLAGNLWAQRRLPKPLPKKMGSWRQNPPSANDFTSITWQLAPLRLSWCKYRILPKIFSPGPFRLPFFPSPHHPALCSPPRPCHPARKWKPVV